MSFVEVLPVEPVIADARARPSSRRQAARERLQAAQRSACGEHARPRAGARGALDVLRRDQHAPGAGRQAPAAANSPPSSARRAGRRTVAAPPRARVDDDRARARGGAPPAPAGRAGGRAAMRAATRRAAPVPQRGPPTARARSRLRSRRRTASLRPPANSWPCSWPLPAITTTSPARGLRDGARWRRAVGDRPRRAARSAIRRRSPRRSPRDPPSAGCRR